MSIRKRTFRPELTERERSVESHLLEVNSRYGLFSPEHRRAALRALQSMPNSAWLNDLCATLITFRPRPGKELQDRRKAAALYERAVRLEPLYAMAWYSMAGNYAGLGDRRRADRCFRRAIKLDPWPPTVCNFATTLLYRGRTAAALKFLSDLPPEVRQRAAIKRCEQAIRLKATDAARARRRRGRKTKRPTSKARRS